MRVTKCATPKSRSRSSTRSSEFRTRLGGVPARIHAHRAAQSSGRAARVRAGARRRCHGAADGAGRRAATCARCAARRTPRSCRCSSTSPRRSSTRTRGASCIATSSPRTSCSTAPAVRCWRISAPAPRKATTPRGPPGSPFSASPQQLARRAGASGRRHLRPGRARLRIAVGLSAVLSGLRREEDRHRTGAAAQAGQADSAAARTARLVVVGQAGPRASAVDAARGR